MPSISPSPPVHRRSFSLSRTSSHSSSKHEEDLINSYEAEQERIVNVLSRKLEQLMNEKVDLENALEAENESHVLKLQRELATLRAQQIAQGGSESPSTPLSPTVAAHPGEGEAGPSEQAGRNCATPSPSVQATLEALRRENESLRNRLVDTERDYIRVTRLNEAYREELIDHRRQAGLPTESLSALSYSPPVSPLSHPLSPRGRAGSLSRSNSYALPPPARALSMPQGSLSHPHPQHPERTPSFSSDALASPHFESVSSSTSNSNSAFASLLSSVPESRMTPSSSPMQPFPFPQTVPFGLTYPSVPPPSLSSSVGSGADSRRGSISNTNMGGTGRGREARRVVETGTLRRPSVGASGSGSSAPDAGQGAGQGISVAGS